jgi:sugar/nucleoside kinase (ribokinase family)
VHAQVLQSELEAEGIDCTWVAYDQPSQHSAVIVARGDATRSIIWLPQPMADERTVERIPEFLEGADVVMLDATDEVLVKAALDECERRGLTTVLDTGSGRPWTRSLLGRVDHVIAPEAFVLKETGHSGEQAAVELWGEACRVVFGVTQGPRGGVFATGNGLETMRRWEAAPVTGVDSCGAGDTFHGAYAWAVARGLPPAECFDTAAWSAALKVTRLGNEGIPTLEQLESARRSGGAGKPV